MNTAETIIEKKCEIARLLFLTENEDIINKLFDYSQKLITKEKKVSRIKTLEVKVIIYEGKGIIINGVDDYKGRLIPCRIGDFWCPVIDIDSGIITNWECGKRADIYLKVCDEGSYYIKDENGKTVMFLDGYVPEMMCPKESGYGDYIIMDIDENGLIGKWKKSLKGFVNVS